MKTFCLKNQYRASFTPPWAASETCHYPECHTNTKGTNAVKPKSIKIRAKTVSKLKS